MSNTPLIRGMLCHLSTTIFYTSWSTTMRSTLIRVRPRRAPTLGFVALSPASMSATLPSCLISGAFITTRDTASYSATMSTAPASTPLSQFVTSRILAARSAPMSSTLATTIISGILITAFFVTSRPLLSGLAPPATFFTPRLPLAVRTLLGRHSTCYIIHCVIVGVRFY